MYWVGIGIYRGYNSIIIYPSYCITDFNGYQDTYQAILTNPPAYIVTFPTDTPDFPALNSLLATDYLLVHTIDGAHIYRYFRVNEK